MASGPTCPAPATTSEHTPLYSPVPSMLATFLFPITPRPTFFAQGLGPAVFLPGRPFPQISMASSESPP